MYHCIIPHHLYVTREYTSGILQQLPMFHFFWIVIDYYTDGDGIDAEGFCSPLI